MDRSNSAINNELPVDAEKSALTVIRVRGTIQADLAAWLEPAEVRFVESGDTELVYANLDQSGLYGVLVRLRDLGLSLVSVKHNR